MSEPAGLVERWREVRRHPAFQVAAVYVGGSWAVIQLADIFFPSIDIVRALGIVLAVGFVVVVGGAWWLARGGGPEDEGGRADPDGVETVLSSMGRPRRRHLAYTAALLLILLGGVFWWLRPAILGAVNPDAQVIAVLPFNASGREIDYLSEGMVDLLSPNLDAVGGIRTVDTRTVLHRWRQRAETGSLDFEGALAVGRDVDAGAVLLGSVVSAGREVLLRAELYTVRGNELARVEVRGAADSVLALVDSLGINLLRKIWLAREPVPNLRIAGITTGSVEAIRAYLRGQQHYRRSEWDSAAVEFERAVEADSTFALAHYRLGLTYGWSTRHGGFGGRGAREHGQLALRYADRLPVRERTLVVAHNLFETGRVAAHDTMLAYVNRYPGDAEGWYMLGDVRYHAQPVLGLRDEDLFEPFDRVLELDPSLTPALIHPLELSLLYDDSARYAHYLETLVEATPPAQQERFRLGKLFWDRPDSLIDAFMGMGEALGGHALLGAYGADHLGPADFMVGLSDFLQSEATEGSRVKGMQGMAMILASVGRLDESGALYDTLWAIAPASPAPFTSLLPVVAGYADTSFAVRALASLKDPPPAAPQGIFLYFRMVYALAQGRSGEARRLGAQALQLDTAGDTGLFQSLIEAGLGWADILDGDTIGGVERLREGLEQAGYGSNDALGLGSPLRYALAVSLASSPETRPEGIRRLRHSFRQYDLSYYAIRYLLLGQALEASGDRVGALQDYTRFIDLWEDADPGLQPRVETARRAVERLTREQGGQTGE